eukprot:COSAG02_NODE_355_length_24011_cov_28.560932_9_plen_133_part_00
MATDDGCATEEQDPERCAGMDDDFLQAAAGPSATDATAMAAEEAMPQRKPHEPVVRDFLRIKVLSMGDGHTGKSCLIKRYCEQRVSAQAPHRPPTVLPLSAASEALPPKYGRGCSLCPSTSPPLASTSACGP